MQMNPENAAGAVAREVLPRGHGRAVQGRVVLDYDARFLRRRRLRIESGEAMLVDLVETVSLASGDALVLSDGRLISVEAADEPLLVVTGDLARLAWHIGNRHTPCQIEAGRLLIRRDRVLMDMLSGLGAALDETVEPFTPEGGAYGFGRTLSHDHGPAGGHLHVHTHISHGTAEEPEEEEGLL